MRICLKVIKVLSCQLRQLTFKSEKSEAELRPEPSQLLSPPLDASYVFLVDGGLTVFADLLFVVFLEGFDIPVAFFTVLAFFVTFLALAAGFFLVDRVRSRIRSSLPISTMWSSHDFISFL